MLQSVGCKESDTTEHVSLRASIRCQLVTHDPSHSGLCVSVCSLLHLSNIFICLLFWVLVAAGKIFDLPGGTRDL